MGALPLNVRMTLKRLCDYVVSCDDYITNLQQINNNQAKRNSRQRLANQKQQDLILNLQHENERLKAKYDNNKSHEINYKYFTTLYSKATKDIVIDDLVYKCEDLDNLRQSYEKLYIDNKILKNSNNRITSGNTLYNKKLNKLKEYVNCRIEEFKNAGKSRKEIKAHQYYMLLSDIEKILNSSL